MNGIRRAAVVLSLVAAFVVGYQHPGVIALAPVVVIFAALVLVIIVAPDEGRLDP